MARMGERTKLSSSLPHLPRLPGRMAGPTTSKKGIFESSPSCRFGPGFIVSSDAREPSLGQSGEASRQICAGETSTPTRMSMIRLDVELRVTPEDLPPRLLPVGIGDIGGDRALLVRADRDLLAFGHMDDFARPCGDAA